ncbi:unnamed protein product [Larinioides sclopetarius]|uniref:Reverse transcriptase domain-containing protein n=1 Tax=Larinioides sclopetarius TaxID=280406 RepID=A0AAV1YTA3_9ARAC
MAYLSKGKKIDLFNLALELRLDVTSNDKIIDLHDKITKSTFFKNNEQFVKDQFNNNVDERKKLEEAEVKKVESENQRLAEERAFELEKLRLQNQNSTANTSPIDSTPTRFDLKTVLPTFNADIDDMSLFLTMFERHMKLLNVSADYWVSYLIGVLPSDVGKLIAREPEEMFKNYTHVRTILLQRFKLTADRFRSLFSRHQKRDHSTWKDFFFELRTYFEGWLNELEISSFDKLKELIIADQIKRKCPLEYKNHHLDSWETLNDPVVLAEKLDLYENIKSPYQKVTKPPNSQEWHKPKVPRNACSQNFKNSQFPKFEKTYSSSTHRNPISNSNNLPLPSRNMENSVYCYGCGYPGFIKSKSPKCSSKKDSAFANAIQVFTCFTLPVALLDIEVYEATGTVCADTGASHSVGGEIMFNFLQKRGQKFIEIDLAVCLADGQQSTSNVLKTTVPIKVHGRTFHTDLIFLPHAKGNRTLLGVDFLRKSGIVMDMTNNFWYFGDKPYCRIPFATDIPLPTNNSPVEINSSSCPRNSITSDDPVQSNHVLPEANNLCLRVDEGQNLDTEKKSRLTALLTENEEIFRLGGEPTPYVKHFINTGDHPPVAATPYRLSPKKKEQLSKAIDELLANDIIEECESPYAAPVVLVPKPNGDIRLCIDYRKLNAITIPDKYPLPLMDTLLHDAKSTAFMSTLDLKTRYHQIEVNPADKVKTAFVCTFGMF